MKRLMVFAATVAGMFAFSTCDLFTEYEDVYKYYDVVEATDAKIWNYTDTTPIYEVDSNTLSVTINNIPSGKTLYLVKHNTGSQNIGAGDTRTIVSSAARAATETVAEADFSAQPTEVKRHFVGEKLPSLKGISARSVLTDVPAPAKATTYTTGQAKQIYIDTNYSMDSYAKKAATLRAVGTNCYVWVIDDYYAETSTGNKVNATVAQKYAAAFDKMYKVITNVFGDESSQIINYDAQRFDAISSLSDTGDKINIVIYDIAADYESSRQAGVVGYFYAKDYYYTANTQYANTIIGKSNVGKYFYIDSGYANSNFDDTISTLAHEFQHMVNFNQKDILHDVSPSAAYNEMLSMLCEDMMQEFLGLQDYASPKNRIQSFNAYYPMSGITEYRNDDYATLSYSTSYAFGSWLCRQYGGADLVKEMSQNAYVDNESIVAAVSAKKLSSFSFETLFKQFLLALTGSTTYKHNQDAASSLTATYTESGTEKTYSYPMKAFNLWNTSSSKYASGGTELTYTFALKGTEFQQQNSTYAYSGYDWYGPFLYSTQYGCELRTDNGISIHGVESTSAGSKTYTFSSRGANTLKMYLIIQ